MSAQGGRPETIEDLRDVLLRGGFVPCDSAVCGCGSWHHRYGYPERMREIQEMLDDAGHPLTNANGNLLRNAVAALIAERDALLEALREAAWRLSCIGTPRDAQGRYHKDGEWTFGDALPNAADAHEVASAFALIRAALTTGESA